MRTVLAGVDGSPASAIALARAVALAQPHRATVHAVRVVPREAAPGARHDALAAVHAACADLPGAEPTCALAAGDPPEALAEAAATIGADLIVVGGHGAARSWADAAFGTTAEALLRRSETPLLIARETPPRPYRRAIAAIAGDDSMRVALALVRLVGAASLCAVGAYELPFEAHVIGGAVAATIMAEQSSLLRERTDRIAAAGHADLAIDAVAIDADLPTALMQAGAGSSGDLLILATHARTGLGWLARGSVTDIVVEQLPGDVLIGRLPHHR